MTMATAAVLFAVLLAAITVAESEYIDYNTTHKIIADKINVHLVPHSHDDVGWLKTVDQYYVGSNNSIRGACVQNVLDSVISALLEDKNRKFIYVEMAFFQRWWRQQSKAKKTKVKELVDSGQLEFINGGMCMHDEATPHYIDLIDQTTLGHQFIKEEFGKTPRVGWQIDPFGHSAVQAYLLGAELGFDSLFFARIDYQDRAKRLKQKTLEVVWRGSRSLGSSSQIFTGIFPRHYDPPDGFTFEINDVSPPIQDDILLFDYNVQERVNDFVSAALAQANVTRTNHIMWTMGTDFRYQYANSWFRQMDKFIHYVNQDGRVNALYSTPSIYTDAKYAANEQWPLKIDDFFPYADHANAYWTGYFTSRPALKGYVRVLSGYYQAARQLEFFKGRNESGPNTDALADALAIAQHHDAVSGTERQHVAADYAKRLSIGYAEAEELVASALAFLVNRRLSSHEGNPVSDFQQCPLLNISYCPPSEATLPNQKILVIVVYNPLAWKRNEVVQIPVSTREVFVQDSTGKEIESQLLPLSNATMSIRKQYVKAYIGKSLGEELKYWLAFPVSVPPLGFSTYILSRPERTGRSSTISMVCRSEGSVNNSVEVGQGNLKLLYSADEGKLTHYVNSRNLIRDFRTDWDLQVNQPIAGNYYPVNLGLYVQDSSTELSVLVDRSVGGSSLVDGQIELMLHRRLIHDDARGVGEALNETVCIVDNCEGLTIQGKLYLRIDPIGEGAKWRRTVGQELYSPLLLAFTEQDEDKGLHFKKSTFSGIDSSYSLPNNTALLTLQEFEKGKVLLRLAHLYEIEEDKDYSVKASVELKKLFPNKKISKVTEMSLSANQERTEMEKNKLVWKVGGSIEKPKVVRGGPVDPAELVVELAPMEIRTFFIFFDLLQTVPEVENHWVM
ncbi:PREDICTED: alpha-mannosidase At3g26720-like isoform X6 [Lupinus angustifolius]|uniref:alpha-mannosidase At3g26720-like isoform X6 n=1 Tax=Lupinus angustifolius TaxID=3871 RepID=UPI00092F7A17|nr:PREDICTED: alpha-mannosidase At3g26720-like isoform X6 [Lupinus angustifolius]